jgi:hypothetical protein
MPARCRGEESMSDLSTTLLAFASRHQPFQHIHVESLVNRGPFWYKFKVDDTSDFEKADQHCRRPSQLLTQLESQNVS